MTHRHKFCGYTELAGLGDEVPGSGFGDDEVGFLPLIPLIGAGASIIGGLLGKKGGKGAPAGGGGSEAALAMAPMMEAIAGKIVSSDEIKGVVRELLATVPPPVKEQVLAVIKAVQAEGGSLREAEGKLVSNIEAKFMPAINQAMQALKHASIQRTATSEHRGTMKDTRRWNESRRAQRLMLRRLNDLAERQARIDARLGGATILPKSKASYLGGKRLVDILARKR